MTLDLDMGENTLRIENITSISAIVNPVTSDLAKSVKAAPEWRNFIPPQAFWSPDGSKLLIRSSIKWYKGEVNFRPSNRNGLLIESQNGQTSSRNDVLIAKLSGYDSIKQGFRAANKSMIIQASNEQTSPELSLTATPQITESITATPRAPGFGATLAIGILYTIYLFKRRYN